MIIYPRWLSKIYAAVCGYFWLPCPICGKYFGGHEWLDNHSIYRGNGSGEGVCYRKSCLKEAQRRSKIKHEQEEK